MKYRIFSFALLLAITTLACGDGSSDANTDAVEVFGWWTSGGEAAALNAVYDMFKAANPTTEIIDAAVAGGGGSAARPVLQTRLVGGDPPDTWQTHPGAEIKYSYMNPGYTESLSDLYAEEGWNEVIPEGLMDLISNESGPHLVVLNLHRSNEMWYNKKIIADNNIDLSGEMTWDRFFGIADQLKTTGVDPVCMGDSGIWATGIAFENTLAGVIGADKYNGLWTGATSFEDPEIVKAAEIYHKMISYQNSDHSALSWDQAVDKLLEGKCVFYPMGDWAYGEFVNKGKKDNEEFGWINHPGTEGIFMMVSDGFAMAQGAPHPEMTKEMLRVMGSKEGQEVFNVRKGSICARTDCDRTKFSEYLNWSMDSYAKDKMTATIVHGSAAPADFQQALNDALTTFVVDGKAEVFAKNLAKAAVSAGIGNP